jgi:hypothetical protein
MSCEFGAMDLARRRAIRITSFRQSNLRVTGACFSAVERQTFTVENMPRQLEQQAGRLQSNTAIFVRLSVVL